MRFHRVRVSQFRRLVEPVEIVEFDPELTVIAGDNEAGKSTLLEAIRVGLFDRYKLTGQHAQSFQPLGHQVAPTIEIDFSLQGEHYALHKRFCQNRAARLTRPDGTVLADDAAEEALNQLLEFTRPGSGASKLEHQGIWGLLWVQQGQTFAPLNPADGARNMLHQVLEAEVGDVLGGALGQEVLARLTQARNRYWTPKNLKPTGAYREAAEAVEALKQRLAEAKRELTGYDDQLTELEAVEARLARLREDAAAGDLERRLEAARAEQQQVTAAEQTLKDAEQQRILAHAQAEARAADWRQRHDLIQETDRLQAAIRQQQAAHRQAAEAQRQAALTVARHRRTLQESDQALSEARRRFEALRDAREQRGRHERLAELQQRLAQARHAADAAQQAADAARAIFVDEATLQAIQTLAADVRALDAQLQSGATTVTWSVSVPVTATGDTRKHDDHHLVTGQARFELEGIGQLCVTAGGHNLPEVQRDLAQRQAELGQLLESHGADSPEHAQRLAADRRHHQQRAEAEKRLLTAHAPNGLEALATEVQEVRARLTAAAAPATADVPETPAELDRRVDAARQAVDDAQQQNDAARTALSQAAEVAEAAATRLAQASATLEGDQRRLQVCTEQLEAQRRARDDAALYGAWQDADTERTRAETALADSQQALTALDPDLVQARLKRATQAVERFRQDVDNLERERQRLRIALETLGQRGLSEQVDRLSAELAATERRYRALDRKAHAVRVACEAVEAAAREARQTFLGPITERIQPYLKHLFPGCDVVLDEHLQLCGIRRDGREERFDSLSIGTREQLAIITRLAFADLLADQGREVPIILDDALVYSDDGRFERMLDILTRAAERHQVIILTCHEAAYRPLGGKLVRLHFGSAA